MAATVYYETTPAPQVDGTNVVINSTGKVDLSSQVTGKLSNFEDYITVGEYEGKYNNSKYYYVNCNSAESEEDGSVTYPFKTLDKALELLNKKYYDLRIYITGAGTYNISKKVIGCCALHICANVAGVKIHFTTTSNQPTFYNCHINFYTHTSKVDITDVDNWLVIEQDAFSTASETYWYTDNALATLKYVNLMSGLKINGGSADFNGVQFRKLTLTFTSGRLYNLKCVNTDPTIQPLEIFDSSVFMKSGFSVSGLTEASSNTCIVASRSSAITWTNSTSDSSNLLSVSEPYYDYLVGINNSRFNVSSKAIATQLKTLCTQQAIDYGDDYDLAFSHEIMTASKEFVIKTGSTTSGSIGISNNDYVMLSMLCDSNNTYFCVPYITNSGNIGTRLLDTTTNTFVEGDGTTTHKVTYTYISR